MKIDLDRHYVKIYPSSIKYYNFLKSNVLAPLSVKLKVLETCVLSSLLHNIWVYLKKIEKLYIKLIKTSFLIGRTNPEGKIFQNLL